MSDNKSQFKNYKQLITERRYFIKQFISYAFNVHYDSLLTFQEKIWCTIYGIGASFDWRIIALKKKLALSNAPSNLYFVKCKKNSIHMGGYSPTFNAVWICGNIHLNFLQFQQTIIHELVHAYDVQTGKMELNNMYDIACSEIRAYNISGQCSSSKKKDFFLSNASNIVTEYDKELSSNEQSLFKASSDKSHHMSQCFPNDSIVSTTKLFGYLLKKDTVKKYNEMKMSKTHCLMEQVLLSLYDNDQINNKNIIMDRKFYAMFYKCMNDFRPFS